jgi:hypothetical protein
MSLGLETYNNNTVTFYPISSEVSLSKTMSRINYETVRWSTDILFVVLNNQNIELYEHI